MAAKKGVPAFLISYGQAGRERNNIRTAEVVVCVLGRSTTHHLELRGGKWLGKNGVEYKINDRIRNRKN